MAKYHLFKLTHSRSWSLDPYSGNSLRTGDPIYDKTYVIKDGMSSEDIVKYLQKEGVLSSKRSYSIKGTSPDLRLVVRSSNGNGIWELVRFGGNESMVREDVSKQDRSEFKGFCKNATDNQLRNIYQKEKEASEWDDDREIYAEIAKDEMEKRGMYENVSSSKAGQFLNLMEDTKKDRMYAQIQKHGERLNAIFNTGLDPVALCKKLFSLENKLRHANTMYTNGDWESDRTDQVEKEVMAKVDKILGYKAKKIPVFNNDDPRGYSLKIENDWMHSHQGKTPLYTDMGGYGILAPDFRE